VNEEEKERTAGTVLVVGKQLKFEGLVEALSSSQ
jgi:hypothetical protein